jgi:hypothetical protein
MRYPRLRQSLLCDACTNLVMHEADKPASQTYSRAYNAQSYPSITRRYLRGSKTGEDRHVC